MKVALLALALVGLAPLAQAQIVIQAPAIPGVTTRPNGDDYWRGRREGQPDEWRRRSEFNEEEHRREEWQHGHCVRDYRGEEYCRR